MKRKRQLSSGFTLIEIICVIGILAVLIAILLPCLVSSRRQAQRQTCLSNIRQLDLALIQYAQDYDGTYPTLTQALIDSTGHINKGGLIWSQLLMPYIKGEFPHCPAVEIPEGAEIAKSNSGYTINVALSKAVKTSGSSVSIIGRSDSTFTLSSLTVSLLEAHIGVGGTGFADTAEDNSDMPKDTQFGAVRHEGGANYAFLDGHTKWYRPSDMINTCDGKKPCFDSEAVGH